MGTKGSSGGQLRLGVILNYINIGLGNLIPIFYTPIMLRLLGQSEYGLYKLSATVTSYLSLVAFGIGSAITRYIIKTGTEEGKEAEEKMFGLFLTIFRVIGLIALLGGVFLIFNVDSWYGASLDSEQLDRMRILMAIMTLNTALSFVLSPYISVVTAHERYVFVQCMHIFATCVIPIANLIVLFMGFASIGMAVSSLVLQFLMRIVYLVYVKRNLQLRPRFGKVSFSKVKEVLLFSFWVFVAEIVDKLYAATDTTMIGAIPDLATNGVAVYHVGTVFSGAVLTIAVGLSGLLSPRTNKLVFEGASNSQLTDFAIRIGRMQALLISLIVAGFIVFGRPFIHYYVGDSYSESYWVALLIMIPTMIPLMQSVCLNIVVAKNMHRFRSLVYLGIAIANVIGTWFLLKTMGVVGAALMTGIARIVGQGFIMNWFYQKKMGLEIARFWKEVSPFILCSVVLICLGLLGGMFVDYFKIPILISGILIFTLVYGSLSWFFIMNQYEKNLFANLLHLKFNG